MKSLHFGSVILLVLIFCSCSSKPTLQSGDLIFVGLPAGYQSSGMGGAVSAATSDGDSLNMIHVAIADVDRAGTFVIDATLKRGVDRHPLDSLYADFRLRDGSLPTFKVMRLKDNRHAREYVENAKAFIGEPYDFAFDPDNDAKYCSELVRDSYRTSDGNYIFDDAPMNFRAPDGTFPEYWVRLFDSLGIPIPQDVPGTNPQDMSRSSALRETAVSLP